MDKTFTLQETLQKVNKMYNDGWCDGCSQDPDDCIRSRQPKCLLIETIQKEDNQTNEPN